MNDRPTWTGCYEVLVTDKAELYQNDTYAAFVNVVAYAHSEAEFRERAAQQLSEDGYHILDVSDVRMAELCEFPDDVRDLISHDLLANCPVAYGPFHLYPKDGLDA